MTVPLWDDPISGWDDAAWTWDAFGHDPVPWTVTTEMNDWTTSAALDDEWSVITEL